MDSLNEDAELASEVVSLLGRELKTAKRRIEELETELAERKARAKEKIQRLKAKLEGHVQKVHMALFSLLVTSSFFLPFDSTCR